MPNRQRELQAMLQSLRLPMMAEVCAELALKAAKEGLSHEAFLYELARLESERRAQQRIERLLAQSGLPREKTFATFQLDRLPMPIRTQIERLRSGEFVKEAINIVAVGPQASGKVTFSRQWLMTWCSRGTPCCGPRQRSSCSDCWPPNVICACRRNWRSCIAMPA